MNRRVDLELPGTVLIEQGTSSCLSSEPTLAIVPAVLLSWPGDTEGWRLESAGNVAGPWAASEALVTQQSGQNTAAVIADAQHRLFRLRKP